MNKYAIIVVGYNRIAGMLRLLNSLEAADYEDDTVTLIISLDNSGNPEVAKTAEKFVWSHGNKKVRTFEERQGLRKHILSCGDFLYEYDAIAVLEDDLLVAPGFYQYMKQAVEFYQNDERIAGISLYTHRVNVNVYEPFLPAFGSDDVFFMQFAQSWGQVWMKKQWFAFKKWYLENENTEIAGDNVPRYVSNWPKTSWLKYHIKYCIATNKYFVYPYKSLSTCFSDEGEHCRDSNTFFQVPMLSQLGKHYSFCNLENGYRYDAFFEREALGDYLGITDTELCVDLYGHKHAREKSRYILSGKQLPFEKLKSFGRSMRPHEENVVYQLEGDKLFLYDTSKAAPMGKDDEYTEISYYYNITTSTKKMLKYIKTRISRTLQKKLMKK